MAANNATYFDAAMSGAIAGEATNWNTDATAADYNTLVAAAVAFATEVDLQIPVDGSPTAAKAQLVFAICSSAISGRSLSSATATDYLAIAKGLAALYTNAVAHIV